MGLALRAVAAGNGLCIVQFLKNKMSGEIKILSALPGVKVFLGKGSNNFYSSMSDSEKKETYKIHNRNLISALSLVKAGLVQTLILDELCAAWNHNLIEPRLLKDLFSCVPDNLELVITGREPCSLFFCMADYITQMNLIRHPFVDKQIPAREGVEF